MANATKHRILIAGGGTGGISTAAALLRAEPALDIGIIEPSEYNYYQPGWTLVGGGDMRAEQTRQKTADVMPDKVTWIKDMVTGFEPDNNRVTLAEGGSVDYDYLIVALGIQTDWDAIEGLTAALGKNGVTSNYSYEHAPYTDKLARNLSEGANALFTQPAMPIKCPGAPQKALYLTADTLRQRGVNANLGFYPVGAAMFGVPAYSRELDKVMADYGATPHFGHDLIAVDGDNQKATFKTEDGEVTLDFDMLHAVPPQSAPDVLKGSPIADDAGWVTVDKGNFKHDKYDNIYGLGDCTNTPNSKTMAAIRRQFPVLTKTLLADMGSGSASDPYDGYAACPLTISHSKVLLAEFRYGKEVVSSFPVNPTVPRKTYWHFKKSLFPYLYWDVMLKGKDWNKPRHKPRPALTE